MFKEKLLILGGIGIIVCSAILFVYLIPNFDSGDWMDAIIIGVLCFIAGLICKKHGIK